MSTSEQAGAGHQPQPMVVVGVDGTPDGDRALGYAMEQAYRLGVGLRLVHVTPDPVPFSPMLPVFAPGAFPVVGNRILADAAARVHAVVDDEIAVEQVLLDGPRADALVDQAEHAVEIVLGERTARPGEPATSATPEAVMAAAPCPVVIVPEGWAPGPAERVVAAVDGTATATGVLAAAFEAAEQREVVLQVVHAWRPAPGYDTLLGVSGGLAWERQVEPEIWALVAGLRADHPDVPVQVHVLFDKPACAVARVARGADLLVVGRRTEDSSGHPALESTARALLRNAPCPVAIVPVPQGAGLPRQRGPVGAAAPSRPVTTAGGGPG